MRIESGWLIEDDWPEGQAEDIETSGAPIDKGYRALHLLSGVEVVYREYPRGIHSLEFDPTRAVATVELSHPAGRRRPLSGRLDSLEARRLLGELLGRMSPDA